jgi:hypothetical protein
MVLWLAQRTDRTTVAALMRCAWESVTALINRGVADCSTNADSTPSTASVSTKSVIATHTAI